MLKNYLLTAWKVFLRRKFFTFVNLFGISLTFVVIIVVSSIVESYLYPKGPEKNSDHYRVIDRLTLTNKEHTQTYGGQLGYKFISENIQRLKTPEIISFYSISSTASIYHKGNKLDKSFKRTDANYWKVLDFNFTDGRSFDSDDVGAGRFVAVINQTLQRELFWKQSAIGQFIVVNNQKFEIIGVVENVSEIERSATADIWLPYTTMPSTAYQDDYQGVWQVIVYHSDVGMLKKINQEYVNLLKNDLLLQHQYGMTVAYSGAFSKLESLSSQSFSDEHSYKSNSDILIIVMAGVVFLFMLLPSINMINLNVSRVLERSSEIGVRKAFGASISQLVVQFIVENMLLTFVGGVIGGIVSVFLLNLLEVSGLIAYAEFSINLRVSIWNFFMIVVFGFISGVYPAIKMSRLNPVTALKGGE